VQIDQIDFSPKALQKAKMKFDVLWLSKQHAAEIDQRKITTY